MRAAVGIVLLPVAAFAAPSGDDSKAIEAESISWSSGSATGGS